MASCDNEVPRELTIGLVDVSDEMCWPKSLYHTQQIRSEASLAGSCLSHDKDDNWLDSVRQVADILEVCELLLDNELVKDLLIDFFIEDVVVWFQGSGCEVFGVGSHDYHGAGGEEYRYDKWQRMRL